MGKETRCSCCHTYDWPVGHRHAPVHTYAPGPFLSAHHLQGLEFIPVLYTHHTLKTNECAVCISGYLSISLILLLVKLTSEDNKIKISLLLCMFFCLQFHPILFSLQK